VVALAILTATIASGSQLTAGHGRSALLAFIAGLLLTFIAVRIHTRLIRAHVSWWFGDIAPGGKHIHHVVFGVILMAGACLLEFGLRPTGILLNVIAFISGAGVALTLDEFALLLNLEDVYWLEEGRRSVDAVVVAVAAAVLLRSFTESPPARRVQHGSPSAGTPLTETDLRSKPIVLARSPLTPAATSSNS
jgi:hypothetical protein